MARHGESFSNMAPDRRLNSLHEQLTPQGLKQAEEFVQSINNLQITRILSSDEDRAHATAISMAKYLGLPVEVTNLVREKSSGDYAGMPVQSINWDVINQNPDFYNKKVPRGESVNDVVERVKKFLEFLENPVHEGTVLVLTHGSFMRIFLGTVFNKNIKETLLNTKIKNLGYYIFSRDKFGVWHIEQEAVI